MLEPPGADRRVLRDFDIARRSQDDGPRVPVPMHVNVGFEVTWVERGGIEFEVGREVLAASTGACVVLPPDLENTPGGRGGVFHQITLARRLLEEAAEAFGGKARLPRDGALIGADERLAALARLVAEEADAGLTRDDPGLSALIHALAVALVRPASPASTGRRIDRRIRRALERIAGGCSEDLSVDELAAAAGMSRFPFLRTFRAQVGESPYQHLTFVRLERAAEALRRSSAPVLEVALACGFGDPGRFARLFRKRYGCLPRQYRSAESGKRHEPPKR